MQQREWEKRADAQFTGGKFMKGLGIGMLISGGMWFGIWWLVYALMEWFR